MPAPNGTTLDPSGVVKGWSIERAAHILEAHGHTDFAINAGGDIAIRGHAAPDTPWTVGIRHPDDRDALAMVLDVVGPAAVATSATYERGAHIIDPRTGQPTTELASVTVIGPDLTLVDAYATAVFVMGLQASNGSPGHPGYDAMAITHDARVHSTPGFAAWRRPVGRTAGPLNAAHASRDRADQATAPRRWPGRADPGHRANVFRSSRSGSWSQPARPLAPGS